MKGAGPFLAVVAFAVACLAYIADTGMSLASCPAAETVPVKLPEGKVLMTGCAGNAPSVLIELPSGRQECRQLVGSAR